MPLTNTALHYGTVTKSFHWLTALLIFTAIPLGVIANRLPYETGEQLAQKAQLFSIHKTVGVAAFAVALLRILWALGQRKPAPLHPERRAETLAAETVHWALYAALVIVPLSGWIHHAATQGFAPILWPMGQSLPFVPTSESVAGLFGSIHWVFTKVLIGAILLHVAGALKHALIDRDATLARMLPGTPTIDAPPKMPGHAMPAILAGGVYAAGLALAVVLAPGAQPVVAQTELSLPTEGNWQVEDGTLSITVQQFGSGVTGQFAGFAPEIVFSETPVNGKHGTVRVEIAISSLTLGSVTEEALGADYFAADRFPSAVFEADIVGADTGYLADGTLSLRAVSMPVTMPFDLTIDGDIATMTGQTTLDRRDYDIGAGQTDDATLGFSVAVDVALTARRTQ